MSSTKLSRRVHAIADMAAIVFYAGTIFVLSSYELDRLPDYPFPGFDKLAHAALYGGLGILVCRFLVNDLRRSAMAAMIIAAALTSLYGLSDEIHQVFVPGRIAAASDFVADAAGAVLACALWYSFMRPKRRPALLILTEAPAQEEDDDLPV